MSWLILVYDRTASERFPLKRKWYQFSYNRATESEIEEVLRLCGYEARDKAELPDLPFSETRETFEVGGPSGTSEEILRYRHLFDYVPDEQRCGSTQDACAFITVNLPSESYCEDESGCRISLVEICDEEMRREHGEGATSIVLDHPESVLRGQPAEPIRPELWTQADADLMRHLSEVYQQLERSRWIRSRCMVTSTTKGSYQAILPLREDCLAVILPFRQLYSKHSADDLFNRCCKLHNRHCPPQHSTFFWVKHYQARFNGLLDEPMTFPLNQPDLPAKRYLDAFAYGAKAVHASSKSNEPAADLEHLLRSHPKEMVVMGYHYILRELLRYVSLTIPVLGWNVNHWVRDLGWAGHRMRGVQSVFDVGQRGVEAHGETGPS